MGLLDAATGGRATYARGLEKTTAGQPQGSLVFLKYDATDSGRVAGWNRSNAITANEGENKGTPGGIAGRGKAKYDLTAWQLGIDLAGMVGAPVITVLTASQAWLLSFYPNRNNAYRGIWDYLFRGSATVGATTTYGRRVPKVTLTADANKRVMVDSDMAPALLGDTLSGLTVAKTGNAGTFTGKIASRGRRPKDAAWVAGKSMYLKVTAKAAGLVTFKAGYDVASVGDGTGFPVVVYDTATFTVNPQSNANNTDGFSTVNMDAGLVGMFDEDFQPFQLAANGTDYSLFAVNDEYEIPAIGPELTFVNLVETRLSAFTMDVTLGGTRSAKFNKGSIDLERPFKGYESNRSRYATAIDPSGAASMSFKMDERFFDNYFRDLQDANTRFQVYAKMQNDNPLPSSTFHEGVEVYAPQCAISALNEGAISNRDTLMHSVTLNAENPDSAVAGPGAYFPGTQVWRCNIVTGIDPSVFFG